MIRFSDGGNGELRPLSFQAGDWSFVNGAGPNWDTTGGSCGYQTTQTYAQVVACHPGAQVTSVEILNDSGWLYPGGFSTLVDNISYAGVTLSGPAAPVADATVNLTQLSGDVVVRVPQAVGGQAPPIGTASGSVAQIKGTLSLPLGSVIDSSDGRVSLFAVRRNRRQVGNFSDGRFRVRQSDDGEVLLTLRGRLDCGARSAGAPRAEASARRRRLWGSSRGRFRTRGSYSSGSVRGTKWLTVDRCDGTLTVVREGVVQVHDYGTGARVLVPRRPVLLRAGDALARYSSWVHPPGGGQPSTSDLSRRPGRGPQYVRQERAKPGRVASRGRPRARATTAIPTQPGRPRPVRNA